MTVSAILDGTVKILKITSQKFDNAQHALANITLPTVKDPLVNMEDEKQALADDIAICYASRNLGRNASRKIVESARYLQLLGALIGRDKVAEKIRRTSLNFDPPNTSSNLLAGIGGGSLAKKYCPTIDQKLLQILIHEPLVVSTN